MEECSSEGRVLREQQGSQTIRFTGESTPTWRAKTNQECRSGFTRTDFIDAPSPWCSVKCPALKTRKHKQATRLLTQRLIAGCWHSCTLHAFMIFIRLTSLLACPLMSLYHHSSLMVSVTPHRLRQRRRRLRSFFRRSFSILLILSARSCTTVMKTARRCRILTSWPAISLRRALVLLPSAGDEASTGSAVVLAGCSVGGGDVDAVSRQGLRVSSRDHHKSDGNIDSISITGTHLTNLGVLQQEPTPDEMHNTLPTWYGIHIYFNTKYTFMGSVCLCEYTQGPQDQKVSEHREVSEYLLLSPSCTRAVDSGAPGGALLVLACERKPDTWLGTLPPCTL